jgi:hypothetical protein
MHAAGYASHGHTPTYRQPTPATPHSMLTPSQVHVSPVPMSHMENVNNPANSGAQSSFAARYPEAHQKAVAAGARAAAKSQQREEPAKKQQQLAQPSGKNQHEGAKPKLPHGLTVQELKDMTKARLQAESSDRQEVETVLMPGTGVPGRQPVSSAFTQSFPSSSPVSFNTGRDSWQQSSGLEQAWESTSVASLNSTAGSEYLGSESAFSAGKQGAFEEVPFGRSRSSPAYVSGPSSLDFAANRQRAMTLSPRPGSVLGNLHEDRPMMSGHVIGFDAAPGSSRGSSPATLWASPKTGLVGMPFNRERTASAPSIPTIPNSSSEDPPARRDHSFPSYGTPNSTSVPGMALVNTSADFSSVFRESPGKGMRPPPGLFPRATESTASSSVFDSSDAGLDSTWGQPSFLTSHALDEAALAESLGTILQMSGAEASGDSGLVDRTDPEINEDGSVEEAPASRSFLSRFRGRQ